MHRPTSVVRAALAPAEEAGTSSRCLNTTCAKGRPTTGNHRHLSQLDTSTARWLKSSYCRTECDGSIPCLSGEC